MFFSKLTKHLYVVDDHVDDDYVDNHLDQLQHFHVHIDFDDQYHNYDYYEMFEHEIDHDHHVDYYPVQMVVLVLIHLYLLLGYQFLLIENEYYQNLI